MRGMEQHESLDRERFTPTRRAFLSASAVTAAVAATPLIAESASAHDDSTSGPGRPVTSQQPDKALRKLLRDIDPRRIEATVNRLVGFGTRHTLSVQDDPVRGIGAARDWIYAQFLEYAAASGGRMTVEKQAFIQPVASRIPVPTQ